MFQLKRVEGKKEEQYRSLLAQAESLLADERDWVANLANTASLLYHSLEEVNWAAFTCCGAMNSCSALSRDCPPVSGSPSERGSAAPLSRREPPSWSPMFTNFPAISPVTPHRGPRS